MNVSKTIIVIVVLLCFVLLLNTFTKKSALTYTREQQTEEWQTFTDTNLGFSIDYPTGFAPYAFENGVRFSETEDGPASISVMVIKKDELHPHDLDPRYHKFEKRISYNNYSGIVTHAQDDTEEFPYSKRLEIQKSEDIYFVSVHLLDFDYEKLWRSFKFLD
jgi:hypothetical protein